MGASQDLLAFSVNICVVSVKTCHAIRMVHVLMAVKLVGTLNFVPSNSQNTVLMESCF